MNAHVPARNRQIRALVVAFGVGSLIAVGLGVYGSTHEPTFFALNVAGFSSGVAAKAWLATGAFVLAVVQLVSALIMYGRIPVRARGGAAPGARRGALPLRARLPGR